MNLLMSNSLLVIDLAPLKTLSGNDPDFMKEILQMISLQSPQLLEKINQEYAAEDFKAMSQTAHKYKSSLQILGNPGLIKMAQEIEDLASAGHHSERLTSHIEIFNQICDQLLDIIQEELIFLTKSA